MSSVAPRRALLALALVAGLAAALPSNPAVAATTSSGVRCTIVGTPKADVLIGTSRRDVICGLGGDDVIRARGGDDLIDGGTGRDVVRGGAGADRVLGGTGSDRLLGGLGRDSVSAGRGRDVVSGGGGEDTLQGGGDGDKIHGNAGDDEIISGPGVDDVDGGLGDNLCIVEAEDESIRCRYDEQPPAFSEVSVSRTAVDVTLADATLTVRVRLTDDTGVRLVQGWLSGPRPWVWIQYFDRVSGSDRDGVWEAKVVVPRYATPGTYGVTLSVDDRQGRSTMGEAENVSVEVTDTDPDSTPPVAALVSVAPAAVDVRGASKSVEIVVRATDDKSGVNRVDICLTRPGTPTKYDPYPLFESVDCKEAVGRTAGTVFDGSYRAVLTVPQGSVGATYNVLAMVHDRIDNTAYYMGPDAFRQWEAGRWCCTDAYAFADSGGRIEVTGTVADTTPAWIEAVTAADTELDTLAHADSAHVRVRARDALGEGEGVTQVRAMFVTDSSLSADPGFFWARLELTSGTVTDGWWEGDVEAPQGTPPGTYHLLVEVDDRAHGTIYTDPEGPFANGVTYQPLAGIPVFTVVDRR